MSVQAMSWVIDYAPHQGAELVVLLMLANHAHADGTGAHPSLAKLAKEARMSRRQVIRIIEQLEAAGTIAVERGAGEYGTNAYTLIMTANEKLTTIEPRKKRQPGVKLTPPTPPVAGDIQPPLLVTDSTVAGDTVMAPEPSVVKPSSSEPTLHSAGAREEPVAETDDERRIVDHVMTVPVIRDQPRAEVLTVIREAVRARGPRSPSADLGDAFRFTLAFTDTNGLLKKPLPDWRLALARWFSNTRDHDAGTQAIGRTPTHPGGHRGHGAPRYADPIAERPIVAGVRRRSGTP